VRSVELHASGPDSLNTAAATQNSTDDGLCPFFRQIPAAPTPRFS